MHNMSVDLKPKLKDSIATFTRLKKCRFSPVHLKVTRFYSVLLKHVRNLWCWWTDMIFFFLSFQQTALWTLSRRLHRIWFLTFYCSTSLQIFPTPPDMAVSHTAVMQRCAIWQQFVFPAWGGSWAPKYPQQTSPNALMLVSHSAFDFHSV